MTRFTRDDIEMAFTVGANRIVSYYRVGDTYQKTEHIDKRRKVAKLAPISPRKTVTNGEMIDTLRGLSEEDDVTVEFFFKGCSNRLIIYNGGRSYGIETQLDKDWKFNWDDFLKNGFEFPE